MFNKSFFKNNSSEGGKEVEWIAYPRVLQKKRMFFQKELRFHFDRKNENKHRQTYSNLKSLKAYVLMALIYLFPLKLVFAYFPWRPFQPYPTSKGIEWSHPSRVLL